MGYLISSRISLSNLVDSTAADNSILGIGTGFKGVSLDFPIAKEK